MLHTGDRDVILRLYAGNLYVALYRDGLGDFVICHMPHSAINHVDHAETWRCNNQDRQQATGYFDL